MRIRVMRKATVLNARDGVVTQRMVHSPIRQGPRYQLICSAALVWMIRGKVSLAAEVRRFLEVQVSPYLPHRLQGGRG
jgi:hypothetical protein